MKTYLLGIVLVIAMGSASADIGAITGAVTTKVALDDFQKRINETISRAENAGDYVVFRNATELKAIVDSWEKANKNLIDTAFDRLDNSQRKFINDARSTAQELQAGIETNMESATKIAELANQSVADLKIFDGQLALHRYAPRVIHPAMDGTIMFKIRGINFDKNDPRLFLPNGKEAKRETVLKQEAIYSVPRSAFPADSSVPKSGKMILTYVHRTPWYRKNEITTVPLQIMLLPKILGTYDLSGTERTTSSTSVEKSEVFGMSGQNTERNFNKGPHDNGWKIRISSVREIRQWGRSGRGCRINFAQEQGFSIQVRVGHRPPFHGNADQYCEFAWTEFLETVSTSNSKQQNGTISWMEDTPLTLPSQRTGYLLKVKSLNSITRSYATSSNSENFYEIQEAGDTLIIKPKIPHDLNEI